MNAPLNGVPGNDRAGTEREAASARPASFASWILEHTSGAAPVYIAKGMVVALAVCAGIGGLNIQARAATGTASPDAEPLRQNTATSTRHLDRSGLRRIGTASFYAQSFGGKKMADGTKMNLHGDNAASRTLPLGTTAKVTNLETRQSAIVTIQDRGPYVNNRIVDLSPSTAQKIGISKDMGLAQVEVAPITVPLPDGSVKVCAVERDTSTHEWTSRLRSQ